WGHRSWPWAVIGLLVAVFVGLVFVHANVEQEKERAQAAVRFHVRGLARLALDWERLPLASERFRAGGHPFSSDLDVFGRASLMQLTDATDTEFGERRLAALLSLEDPVGWPDAISARQQAVRDLAGRSAFREAFAIAAGVLSEERPDPSSLIAWTEGDAAALSPFVLAAAWALPAVAVAAFVLVETHTLAETSALAAAVGVIVVGALFGLRLTPMLEIVSARQAAATRWRAMLAAIENEPFEAPLLRELRQRLAGDVRASAEMAALARIVGFVDARRNEVFRFIIGPLLMWDVHCARALWRWRARSGRRVRGWLDALGEVEALASLAAFAFENPDFAWPSLAAEPCFQAEKLGHPLLPRATRIGNDVDLPAAGLALVVTGSNMSGKSTLLRAMGVNAVLANAGAPVCAEALRLGPLRVATSMRVEDSLAQGVSHFYAELARLKSVIDRAKDAHQGGRAAVFFLLDEILHGTNSRERVLGASAVVRELLSLGALGAVSTHDLGITALERELGGRVTNVHLEEHVEGDKMTFDYVLRPGIVQTSNALRLMKAVGIDVPLVGLAGLPGLAGANETL
ncbi:MAG TPA: MutS family DNA mismatch repair protein, partial [Polyangiaceae bacterium]|nr:MutS family DNA mismatch repair protein [Polyangiaceae bacterium]